MRTHLLLIFLASSLPCLAAVDFAEYYDNRDAVVMWTSADIQQGPGSSTFERHISACRFAASNHVAMTLFAVAGRLTDGTDDGNPAHPWPGGWEQIAELLPSQYFHITPHNYDDTTVLDNEAAYYLAYVTARQEIFDALALGWQHTYKGQEFGTCYSAFGGATLDYAHAKALCWTNNYLIWTGGRNEIGELTSNTTLARYQDYDWAPWNNSNMFCETGFGVGDAVLNAGLAPDPFDEFDDCLAGNLIFQINGHQGATPDHYALPDNTNVYNLVVYVGNRHNVWYTGPENLYLYRYLTDQNPPTLSTISASTESLIFQVDGSGLPRTDYGLSFPTSYIADKPSGWTASTRYVVEYKDSGGWSQMARRTTNDWYNAENCYRNEPTRVIVSQGLPQNSDTFQIRLRRGGGVRAWFRSGSGE